MNDFFRQCGFPAPRPKLTGAFLVALLPDEAQVDGTLQREIERAWGTPSGYVDFARPTRTITEALVRGGLHVVDLLPAFQRESARMKLYKPRDTHWNRAGNRLAADVLAPAVRELLAARPSTPRMP